MAQLLHTMSDTKIKEENDFLKGVKITFMHFDSDGKITELDSLENISWIEYGDKEHSDIREELRGTDKSRA